MGVYIFIVIILFAFSFHELVSTNEKTKKILLVCSYILMVGIVGLRWETGTDWEPYLALFETSTDLRFLFLFNIGMEPAYVIFNYFIRVLTPNYSIFLFVLAALMYFFYFKSFIKLTKYPQLANLLLFTSTLGIMGSNRQLLATSIVLFGIASLQNKKKIKLIGSIIISFFFHTTSLLASVYYFLNRKIKAWILYLSIIIAYLISKTQLPLALFSLFGGLNSFTSQKTDFYLGTAQNELSAYELSFAGLLKRLIFVFIFIFFRNKIVIKMPHYNLLLNGYVFGTVFYFLFSTTLLVMVSRGSVYFAMMEPILLTSILYILRRDIDKIVFLFIMLAYAILVMYQSISPYPDLFDPYKSIFINSNFHRHMY